MGCSAIRIGIAFLASAILLHSASAEAVQFFSPLGAVDAVGGGQIDQCGVDVGLFTLTIPQTLRYNTDDGGGQDFYDIYLVDAHDKIVGGAQRVLTAANPIRDTDLLPVHMSVAPAAAPYRFVVVDTTSTGQVQHVGATFNQVAGATVPVSIDQLTPFCPGSGDDSKPNSATADIPNHINAVNATRTFENILEHLARVGDPGATGTGGRALPKAKPADRLVRSDEQPFGAYVQLRPEALRERRTSIGHKSQRNALKTMMPYLSSDSAQKSGFFAPQPRSTLHGGGADARSLPGGGDMSKADTNNRYSLWFDGSVSQLQDSQAGTGGNGYDGDTITISAGADIWVREDWLTGLSVSYSDTYLAILSTNGIYDETGYSVSPYVLYRPYRWLDLSAAVGVSTFAVKRATKKDAVEEFSNTKALSAFFALNAEASTGICSIDGVNLTGSTGFVRAVRRDEGAAHAGGGPPRYLGSDFAQFSGDGELSLLIPLADGVGLKPYVTSDVRAEFLNRVHDDGLYGEFGGGVRYLDDDANLKATIESTAIVGQDDHSDRHLSGNLVVGFDTELFGGGEISPGLSVATSLETMRTDLGVNYENDGRALSLGLSTYMSGVYASEQGTVSGLTNRERGIRFTGHLSF